MQTFIKRLLKKIGIVHLAGKQEVSDYQYAKGYKELLRRTRSNTLDVIFIVIGIFSASFGFKGFLLTNRFIDGGATGISLLLSNISAVPLWALLILVNIPFIILGFKIVGKTFAIKTSFAILGLALCVSQVEFPNVTNNEILVAIFGGFFLGAGIGFSMRGGAVIDGTEILAIYLSKKIGSTIGDVIIIINVIIFSAAMYFLSVEIALFSMVTYLAASKTLDFIIEGIDEYIGIIIVSTHHEEIRQMIISKMGRGITIYKGEGGFGRRGSMGEIKILYSVITRLELNKVKSEIESIDPNAFVVMHSVKDTTGGMIKKKPLK